MDDAGRPQRIQLSRKAGFNLQATSMALNGLPAVSVARPGRWGNPFKVGGTIHRGLDFSGRDQIVRDAAHAVQLFRGWLFSRSPVNDLAPKLRGKNLACWCALDQPCHADVLLELANTPSDGADHDR